MIGFCPRTLGTAELPRLVTWVHWKVEVSSVQPLREEQEGIRICILKLDGFERALGSPVLSFALGT